MGSNNPLPDSSSSSLILTQPTDKEKFQCWVLNGQSWRGALPTEAYYRREAHLASQPLTANGGLSYWILVDSNEPKDSEKPRRILSACETIRKRAFITSKGGTVEEIIAHGVGSVFCNPDFRGRGYARRMMKELGKHLESWQQEGGKKTKFTEFYGRAGWKPFPSAHISLPPFSPETHSPTQSSPSSLPKTTPLHASDIPTLCKLDEQYLKNRIADFSSSKSAHTRVALIPDALTIHWMHAREEFVAQETLNRDPLVKGAMVNRSPGKRVWAIWTRTFGGDKASNILHILRLVIEGEDDITPSEASGDPSAGQHAIKAAAAVLQAAQHEAQDWDMGSVEVWNPTRVVVEACGVLEEEGGKTVELVDREMSSVCCLMWYGDAEGKGKGNGGEGGVEWVGNEKFAWC
ncbi:MAG: hypothetical protein MMC33_003879 [Icmadophila ericetorum]|nr:hypothetical protein [Icmadophila ericetorum]